MSFDANSLTFQNVWEDNYKHLNDHVMCGYLQNAGLWNSKLSMYYDSEGAVKKHYKPAFKTLEEKSQNTFRIQAFLGTCSSYMNGSVVKKRKFQDFRRFQDLSTPSTFGKAVADKPESWMQQQQQADKVIFCLRPMGSSFISVCLMNKVFAEIATVLSEGQPEPEDWKFQAELVASMASAFALENARRDEINKIMQKYIALPVGLSIGVRGVSGTNDSDGSSGQDEIMFNIEYKNEKGDGGADPYMQNTGYYAHYWAINKTNAPNRHCCPWLMVEVLGQEMGISGASFACNNACVQPLSTNVPFLDIPQDKRLQLMQGRLCMAMRVGFAALNEWYKSAALTLTEPDPQAQFPFQRSFHLLSTGEHVEFTYQCLLHQHLMRPIFLATRNDTGEQIVVKFTASYSADYGVDAHNSLAARGMAPQLLGHQEVSDITMVVMEYITDSISWPEAPAESQKIRLREIVNTLHRLFFVHGDLRAPNVLVKGDGVFLIDFDWAGRQGTARYPLHLNPDVEWHTGAGVGAVIEYVHDTHMVGVLCQPVTTATSSGTSKLYSCI